MIKKKLPLVIAVILLVSAVMSHVALPVTASSEVPRVYDCVDAASPVSPKELKASEFLALLTGEEISGAEAGYVDSVLEKVFRYSDSIPVSRVAVHYDGGKIYVSAASYEYRSADGTAVTWTPQKAVFGDEEKSMGFSSESGSFECDFEYEYVENDDTMYVNVVYSFGLNIKGDDADAYKNYAYKRAIEIDGEQKDYDIRLAAYNKYAQYLEDLKTYSSEYARWQKYDSDKTRYDIDFKKYTDYCNAMIEYEKKMIAFLAYKESKDSYPDRLKAYTDYLESKKEYNKKSKEYEDYLALVSKAEAKLETIENVFVKSSTNKVMYNTLWGSTVQEVVSRKDELINMGKADPKDITNAGDATERLRVLLKGYKELTSKAEKYNYYVENYEAIKADFILLYRSLHQLYENEAVYAGIVFKDRLNRYVEFLSHLYVLQSGFDDSYNRDESWKIKREYDNSILAYRYYSYKDVLEECQIPSDFNKASPGDLLRWPVEVEEPVPPEHVDEPTILPEVKEPIKPDYVPEPTEPEFVKKPDEPIAVESAEKPASLTYTAAENELIREYREGKITERRSNGDVVISFTSACRKIVPVGDRYTVTFYDDDGATVLYEYVAGYKDTAEFSGAAPSKENTKEFTYQFEGWRTADGKIAESFEVTEYETVFYASYRAEKNRYNVTWKVNGAEYHETYYYGDEPKYKGTLTKPQDEMFKYTFSSWSPALEKVSDDVIYEAKFDSELRKYNVMFVVDGKSYIESFSYGEIPSFSGNLEKEATDIYMYKFIGWNEELSAVTSSKIYTAQYSEEYISEDGKGNFLTVSNLNTDGVTEYRVSADGRVIRLDRLCELASQKGAAVRLSMLFGEVNVYLSSQVAASIAEGECAYISISKADTSSDTGVWAEYVIELLNAGGESCEPGGNLSITVNEEKICPYTNVYGLESDSPIASTIEENAITFKLAASGTVRLKNEYTITVSTTENGVITPDKRSAVAGEGVKFELLISNDFLLDDIISVGAESGARYQLDEEMALVMPGEPINVSITLTEKTYTITFISDGKIISQKVYKKGDLIEVPDNPVKEGTEDKIYQFIEWDPFFKEGMLVSGDATYNAVFRELLVEDQKGFVPEEDNRFIEFAIILICCFLVFVAAIIVLIIIMIKRRRKKKNKKKSDRPTEASNQTE